MSNLHFSIKVCGMRDADNIRQVAELGVDYIGLDFRPQSPRLVSMIPTHAGIIPDKSSMAGEGISGNKPSMAPEGIPTSKPQLVGVFADEVAQTMITRAVSYRLHVLQLNGHETPTLIRNLRSTLSPDLCPGIQIWKTLSVATVHDFDAVRQYEDCVDAFVFDIVTGVHDCGHGTDTLSCGGGADNSSCGGGADTSSCCHLLDAYQSSVPFMLSGAIGPDDSQRMLAVRHPRLMGVDLNTGFETAPARKDIAAIKTFMQQL